MTRAQSSSGYSQVLWLGPAMPALVTRMSMLPCWASSALAACLLDGLGIGHVDTERRSPSHGRSRLAAFAASAAIHIPDRDMVAPLCGETLGNGAADALRAAGHDGDALLCRSIWFIASPPEFYGRATLVGPGGSGTRSRAVGAAWSFRCKAAARPAMHSRCRIDDKALSIGEGWPRSLCRIGASVMCRIGASLCRSRGAALGRRSSATHRQLSFRLRYKALIAARGFAI